jgi:hypothetical protein
MSGWRVISEVVAEHESQGERHIRLLAALAFVSPP